MSYEVINEELKIAKCSIADLTMGQVHNFLKSWRDDSKIGTLTMFYDREKELLVLNEDNDMYETCLMTATAYLSGVYERRKELLKNAPEGPNMDYCFDYDITLLCHTILNQKQFERFLWPDLKAVLDVLAVKK